VDGSKRASVRDDEKRGEQAGNTTETERTTSEIARHKTEKREQSLSGSRTINTEQKSTASGAEEGEKR
jgi:hypothetical protein